MDFTTGIELNNVSFSLLEPHKFGEGEFFFVAQKPQLLPKYQNISFPFEVTVWSLLFTSTVAMMVVMCVAHRAALVKQLRKFKVQ